MKSNQLNSFIQRNNLNINDIENELYNMLLRRCLEVICYKLKKDEGFKNFLLNEYRKSTSDVKTTQKLALKICRCQLSDVEAEWLFKCIMAHFKKKTKRYIHSEDERKAIINKQNNRCAYCGSQFNNNTSVHLDHIIPWDFVGDELENNLQALCGTCNTHKGNSIDYKLKTIII